MSGVDKVELGLRFSFLLRVVGSLLLVLGKTGINKKASDFSRRGAKIILDN